MHQRGSHSETHVIATIEARMASTRLPGKVLEPIGGEPMLAHLVRRVQVVKGIHEVVVATTTSAADDAIEAIARTSGAKVFRGSEQDVLGRIAAAAREYGADVVVALTADNPLVDPAIVKMVLDVYLSSEVDLVANNLESTFPDGMDVQVVRAAALREAIALAESAEDHEHLTRVIRRNPDRFRSVNVEAPPELSFPELVLTVDERDDLLLVQKIVDRLGHEDPTFSCEAVIRLVRNEPELLAVNSQVTRRY